MFSEREDKIIKAIGNKELNFEEIAKAVFTDRDKPFEPSIAISNSIRRISNKCDYYNLQWTLIKKTVDRKVLVKKVKV